MTQRHQVRLVVTSHSATLAQLEPALGESVFSHHDLGSARANGLVRQQSVWFGRWGAASGEIEDLLEEVLGWLEERKCAITAIDPSAFLKVICVSADGGLAIAAATASKLAKLDVHLLVDLARPADDEA